MKTYAYPAKIEKDGDCFVISFRDIPECNWCAFAQEKVVPEAAKALGYALEFYFEGDKIIPPASKAKKGEVLVELPISLVSKIVLHNTMLQNRYRPADLAKALGISAAEVVRITNPKHNTKIDTMVSAIKACGGSVQLVSF